MKRARHNAFSLIETIMVVTIIGVLAAITIPRFADAGVGRRLNAAKRVLSEDVQSVKLQALATSTLYTIQFYPDENMYVVFEGTDIKVDNIVLARDFDDEPFGVDLARTNLGAGDRAFVSAFGELGTSFTVELSCQGSPISVGFGGVSFTEPSVRQTDSLIDIELGVLDLKVGSDSVRLGSGL